MYHTMQAAKSMSKLISQSSSEFPVKTILQEIGKSFKCFLARSNFARKLSCILFLQDYLHRLRRTSFLLQDLKICTRFNARSCNCYKKNICKACLFLVRRFLLCYSWISACQGEIEPSEDYPSARIIMSNKPQKKATARTG